MKLLFISQSARIIQDFEGSLYLNSHMNKNTIKRYADLCDDLHMVIRDSGIRCSKKEACEKYDEFPCDIVKPIVGFNPYVSMTNYINISLRKHFVKMLYKEIDWADKVIISSATSYYAQKAIPICKEKEVDYLLLVGGFAFETNWNHSIKGKIVACFNEKNCKKNLLDAPYALYVTKKALQDRYPCIGRTIGCSDVEIVDLSPEILEKRLKRIKDERHKIILGTVGNIDDKQKGHRFVIKAISMLKQKGHMQFEYHLLGAGSGERLLKYARKCGVEDQVILDGAKPHNEVYEWLDKVDIYMQPSFSEGLPRAVVEAMSRACPTICTDVGGNGELCSQKYLTRKGNAEEIAVALSVMFSPENQKHEAINNFKKACEYYYVTLDKRRNNFLRNFTAHKN